MTAEAPLDVLLTFRVSSETAARATAVAAEGGRSRSDLIREALAKAVKDHGRRAARAASRATANPAAAP